MEERLKSVYVDTPAWGGNSVLPDDFLVCIGKRKSNTVYHVVEVRSVLRGRTVRWYCKVLVSDLGTALRRGQWQQLHPLSWYIRKKKVKEE